MGDVRRRGDDAKLGSIFAARGIAFQSGSVISNACSQFRIEFFSIWC
jgi:hypothetical protein